MSQKYKLLYLKHINILSLDFIRQISLLLIHRSTTEWLLRKNIGWLLHWAEQKEQMGFNENANSFPSSRWRFWKAEIKRFLCNRCTHERFQALQSRLN